MLYLNNCVGGYDFQLEDKEQPRKPTLLYVDQYQSRQELSESLRVDESTVNKRLKTMNPSI